ncbi:MAG: transketolase [Pseudomonadota bacterium]
MNETEKHAGMANAIRFLSMDAVQKANSGHPGLPMGVADLATVLFSKFLVFDPKDPEWPNRDRFVLSAGHGSMLLYSLHYLLGYEDMDIKQIKNFRQLGSITAGHPEFGHASGIETTTGPLGQGIANAVGMAIAERKLADEFGGDIVDHRTWCIVGDGCLMEGISQEAIALAGHLKLSKLTVIWDDNNISIDGPLSLSDSTDQVKRFEASGWDIIEVDGHDPEQIAEAMARVSEHERPTLIAANTTIGYGAPTKAGTAKAHGSPLGDDEIKATRKALEWECGAFKVPEEILDAWRIAGLRSGQKRKEWEKRFSEADPEIRGEFERRIRGDLPAAFGETLDQYRKKLATDKPVLATRKSSENTLEIINGVVTETLGGSADLTGSNNTRTSQTVAITPDDFSGRYLHYGIREHGMAAAMNGITLHGGLIPYGGTFLVFSDYSRPAIRLAALMKIRVIHVLTHDSIGLGEDGPTHQPVEQIAALRAIPNLQVLRPADAMETAECWQIAFESQDTPSALALTRQNLAAVRHEYEAENLCSRGAYELRPASNEAQVTLFASGSEVHVALEAQTMLEESGVATRVVSVPCVELFDKQSEEYRNSVIGEAPARVAVEAAVKQGWERFIGEKGAFVGMDSFGASGPYEDLFDHFGITADAVVAAATEILERQ